jgi:glucose uptake protein GlcU
MKRTKLIAGALALALLLPGAQATNSRLELVSGAQAQMIKAEPVDESASKRVEPWQGDEKWWQHVFSTLSQIGESVRHQGPNLTMSLGLALMLLMLIGARLNIWQRRRNGQTDEEPVCKCGLPAGHCQWCKKGES